MIKKKSKLVFPSIMDHFGQDFPTWPSLVWSLPPNSSVSLDFACEKKKSLIAWIGLREDKTIVSFL